MLADISRLTLSPSPYPLPPGEREKGVLPAPDRKPERPGPPEVLWYDAGGPQTDRAGKQRKSIGEPGVPSSWPIRTPENRSDPTGPTPHRGRPVRKGFRRRLRTWGLALAALAFAALAVACNAPLDYGYDYALKAPGESAGDVIETDRLRVRVAPTAALGVVHVAVTNKSLEPVAVAWQDTYFVNPHGHRHQAVDRNQAVIRAPDASMREGGIAPGATWRGVLQPGGAPTSSPARAGASSYQGDLSPVDRQLVLNPLTVTVYEGGEVALGSGTSSFLPAAGNAPELAEAYKGQEFHLVLGLRAGDNVTPYRFDFVITNVQVLR